MLEPRDNEGVYENCRTAVQRLSGLVCSATELATRLEGCVRIHSAQLVAEQVHGCALMCVKVEWCTMCAWWQRMHVNRYAEFRFVSFPARAMPK